MSADPRILGVEGGDVELLGLLCLLLVLRPCVDAQVLHLRTAERTTGDHALHGLDQDALREAAFVHIGDVFAEGGAAFLLVLTVDIWMFWAAANLLDGFAVAGFAAALIGSLIYSLCGMVIDVLIERLFPLRD